MKVQCQICKYVFDDGTDPEGVLVPYIGLPQVTCGICADHLKRELTRMETNMRHAPWQKPKLVCPSCESKNVRSIWIPHRFQYGDVVLNTKTPLRICLQCNEEWLDAVGEDSIEKAIAIYLSRVNVGTAEWEAAAKAALSRADAYSLPSAIELMRTDKVPIAEMDEWCQQAREDYPCFFQANIVEGLS